MNLISSNALSQGISAQNKGQFQEAQLLRLRVKFPAKFQTKYWSLKNLGKLPSQRSRIASGCTVFRNWFSGD